MSLYTRPPRNSSRADRPFHPGQRHRANFARGAVFEEFGRAAFAIDQNDFQDHEPHKRATEHRPLGPGERARLDELARLGIAPRSIGGGS